MICPDCKDSDCFCHRCDGTGHVCDKCGQPCEDGIGICELCDANSRDSGDDIPTQAEIDDYFDSKTGPKNPTEVQ